VGAGGYASDRLAALKPDRSGLLEPHFSWVTSINDRPAAEWLAAAEAIVSQASPQYRRHLALEQLSDTRTVSRQLLAAQRKVNNKFGSECHDPLNERWTTKNAITLLRLFLNTLMPVPRRKYFDKDNLNLFALLQTLAVYP
jgi:hypothetical protein